MVGEVDSVNSVSASAYHIGGPKALLHGRSKDERDTAIRFSCHGFGIFVGLQYTLKNLFGVSQNGPYRIAVSNGVEKSERFSKHGGAQINKASLTRCG